MLQTLFAICSVVSLLDSDSESREKVGPGIDWDKKVFIQEYWIGQTPKYLIANLGKAPVNLQVCNSERPAKTVAGPWELNPKAILHVDTPKDTDGAVLQFRLASGRSLGFLSFPLVPKTTEKGKIVTTDGLNGSGGRLPDLWCVQSRPSFPSAGLIDLTLMIPSHQGVVSFKKIKNADTPIHAAILKVQSPTLPVQENEDDILLDTTRPKEGNLHTVHLQFQAPDVTEPTLVVLTGFCLHPTGGSFHIVRGVIVEPAKK